MSAAVTPFSRPEVFARRIDRIQSALPKRRHVAARALRLLNVFLEAKPPAHVASPLSWRRDLLQQSLWEQEENTEYAVFLQRARGRLNELRRERVRLMNAGYSPELFSEELSLRIELEQQDWERLYAV